MENAKVSKELLDRVEEHKELVLGLNKIYYQKNVDYGDSFNKSLDEDGLLVAKIRIMDKVNRFKTLLKADEALVKDESIEDTLLDMANYALMTVMWLNKNKQ